MPSDSCLPHQQEGVVWISPQGLADLLELSEDASGLGPGPTAAALSALLSAARDPRAPRPPGDASRAAPWGVVSGSRVLQTPAAPTPPARPFLPAGAALGRPPPEAGAGHLQRATSLPHGELQLRQLEAKPNLSRLRQPRPEHAPGRGRSRAWKTAAGGTLGGAKAGKPAYHGRIRPPGVSGTDPTPDQRG